MHKPSTTPFPLDLPSHWRREIDALIAATPLALFARAVRDSAARPQPRIRRGAASPT